MFVTNSVMQLYESINSYLLDKCIALSNTGGGTFIRESTWQFPVIEGVHVLSIAMSVGMILWFDLRLLGASMRNAARFRSLPRRLLVDGWRVHRRGHQRPAALLG